MEVKVHMYVHEEDVDSGRVPSFDLLGFYPGASNKDFKKGNSWLEVDDDKSVLPVAHLMERAFKQNKMVIFKKPDQHTQKLIRAYHNKTRLDATIRVSMVINNGGRMWQGEYKFDFYIAQMLSNQSDERGNKWETFQLNIIDRTEEIAMPE